MRVEVGHPGLDRLVRRADGTGAGLQLLAIALAAALLIGLIGAYIELVASGGTGPRQTDFVAYYSGSHLLSIGRGNALYDFHLLGQYEARLVHPLRVQGGVLPYVYPPYFAVFLTPLGLLPYDAAFSVWLLLNLGMLIATIGALQAYLNLRARGAVLLWLSTLSFVPVFVALAQGQTSILLLFLLSACFLRLRGGSDAQAGVLLALALLKPPYVIPFLLMFVCLRRWRALGSFAVSALVLASLPIAVFGPSQGWDYLHTLIVATRWHIQFGYGPALNHSLAGFVALLVPAPFSTVAVLALDLLALGALACLGVFRVRLECLVGLASVVALLIAPHVLIHDLALLVLPVAIALRHRSQSPIPLTPLLVLGSVLILAGLRLVAVVPLQLSVLVMVALGCWLASTGLSRSTDESNTLLARPGRVGSALSFDVKAPYGLAGRKTDDR